MVGHPLNKLKLLGPKAFATQTEPGLKHAARVSPQFKRLRLEETIMEKLFSYGTLQLRNVQIETFGRELDGDKDALLGYYLSEIEIQDKDVIKTSGTNIHPILRASENPYDEVKGTVFEITIEELFNADQYEVSEYMRVSAKLKSGKTTWIYAASEA